MNRTANILIAFLLCIVSFPLLCIGQVTVSSSKGKIQFNVLMPNDVLIPFLSVVVEGEQFRKELSLSADDIDAKVNLVEVPVGTYRVSSQNGNYYEFQRAPFRVQAGSVTKINVFPLLRVRTQMLMADGSDRYQFAPKPKYDSVAVPHSPDDALKMLVRYDKKRRVNGSTEYSSNVIEFRGSLEAVSRGVMVSYDGFTLYADKVRLDPTNFSLYADGNVVVEDGSQRIRAAKLMVKFTNGAPEFVT